MSKPLDRLTLLNTFVRIVDAGSISAAARDLGLTQPSASRHLAELEARLESQLVRRNTHGLALTAAGTELLADARQLLNNWEVLEEKHRADNHRVTGQLKVVAPIALGQTQLAKLVAYFQLTHPAVTLHWELNDQPIRFSEVGCDCWIKVGPITDDTLIVKKLGEVERILVASPEFLDGSLGQTVSLDNSLSKQDVSKHGGLKKRDSKKSKKNSLPSDPQQLVHWPLLSLSPFEGGRIPLSKISAENKRGQDKNSQTMTITPPVRTATNNIFALKQMTLQGLGMAVMPRWFIQQELEQKALVHLLPEWQAPSLDIFVGYLPSPYPSLRLKSFLQALYDFAESL